MHQTNHSGRDSKHFQTISHIVNPNLWLRNIFPYETLQPTMNQHALQISPSTCRGVLPCFCHRRKHLPHHFTVIQSNLLLTIWSAYTLRRVKVVEKTSWTLTLLIHVNSACWIQLDGWDTPPKCQRIMDGQNLGNCHGINHNKSISARWPCLPVTSLTSSSCSDKWTFPKWNLLKLHHNLGPWCLW